MREVQSSYFEFHDRIKKYCNPSLIKKAAAPAGEASGAAVRGMLFPSREGAIFLLQALIISLSLAKINACSGLALSDSKSMVCDLGGSQM